MFRVDFDEFRLSSREATDNTPASVRRHLFGNTSRSDEPDHTETCHHKQQDTAASHVCFCGLGSDLISTRLSAQVIYSTVSCVGIREVIEVIITPLIASVAVSGAPTDSTIVTSKGSTVIGSAYEPTLTPARKI